jgi:LacI family transcriptional regulator
MSRPTQADVAKHAGVSRATVSLVINDRVRGNVRISEETQRRVWAAVEELGYQPNEVARSLRTQRTQLLALMVPDLANPFYPLLIRGAQSVVNDHDYQMLVYDSDDKSAREASFVDIMLRRRVDGVILVAFHLKGHEVQRLIKAGIEVVAIGPWLGAAGIDVVAINERQAVNDVVRYLAGKGHQRIAHLAGSQDTPPGQYRLEGYRQGLAKAGLAYDPALVCFGVFRGEGIAELIPPLMSPPEPIEPPTAIVAANDLMAIEALRALKGAGYRVPQDVAVCGFDDIPQAEWVTPSLTTVGQNVGEMGRQAAMLLLQRLVNGTPNQRKPARVTVPHKLVIRDST